MIFRTLPLVGAAALAFASPAPAQQQSTTGQPTGQSQSTQATQSPSAGEQQVSPEEMQQYVRALNDMARFEPPVVIVLQSGDTVEIAWIDSVTRPETLQALQDAGLSKDEFRQITQEIHQDPQTQQQYRQTVQQMTGQQPGGAPSTSGAAPSSSPSGTTSGAAPPGAQPGSSPR